MKNSLILFICVAITWRCSTTFNGTTLPSEDENDCDIAKVFSGDNSFRWLHHIRNGALVKIVDQQKAKQFACQLNIQQQLVDAVFAGTEKQTNVIIRMNPELWNEYRKMRNNFKIMKQNDHVLYQQIEELYCQQIQLSKEISNEMQDFKPIETLLRILKFRWRNFALFLAKRLKIPLVQILSQKKMVNNAEDMMQKLIELWAEQNRENYEKQDYDERYKHFYSREIRFLRFIMNIVNDQNGMSNLRLKAKSRRRKRNLGIVTVIYLFMPMIMLLFLILVGGGMLMLIDLVRHERFIRREQHYGLQNCMIFAGSSSTHFELTRLLSKFNI